MKIKLENFWNKTGSHIDEKFIKFDIILLTGKVRVIQNICDMACHENQKFWGIFFHTHMGTS